MCIGMTTSRSSAVSINVLLIFNMHDLNVALFLNETSFSALSFSFAGAAKTSIAPFKIFYASQYHTSLS